MKKHLFSIIMLVSACLTINAQNNLLPTVSADSGSGKFVAQMRKTYNISLLTIQGTKISGKLTDLSDGSLAILANSPMTRNSPSAASRTIGYADIDQMKLRKRGTIGGSIAIGIVVGAVIGGIVGNAHAPKGYDAGYGTPTIFGSYYEDHSKEEATIAGVGIGMMGGAIIGGLCGLLLHKTFIIKGQKERYQDMQNKMMKKLY